RWGRAGPPPHRDEPGSRRRSPPATFRSSPPGPRPRGRRTLPPAPTGRRPRAPSRWRPRWPRPRAPAAAIRAGGLRGSTAHGRLDLAAEVVVPEIGVAHDAHPDQDFAVALATHLLVGDDLLLAIEEAQRLGGHAGSGGVREHDVAA